MLSRKLMDFCRYVMSRDMMNGDKTVMEYING